MVQQTTVTTPLSLWHILITEPQLHLYRHAINNPMRETGKQIWSKGLPYIQSNLMNERSFLGTVNELFCLM